MIRGERLAHRRSERLDLVSGRLFAASEHLRLQLRAEQLELVQQRSGHGLNDPVDVNWRPARVRPEIDVDLLRLDKLGENARDVLEERTELECFVAGQLPDVNDVPPWLYDERPDTERADTVLDEPVIRRVDQSTWKLSPPLREITRETAFHREEPTG